MKKTCALLFVFLFFVSRERGVFAQEGSWDADLGGNSLSEQYSKRNLKNPPDNHFYGHRFSGGISTGVLIGKSLEYVYKFKEHINKLSQIDWNFTPVFYMGADIHYDYLKQGKKVGFFIDGTFKYSIPSEFGSMEDRDWTDNTNHSHLTYFSEHNIKTKNMMFADGNLGLQFLLRQKVIFKTYVSYSYMDFSWSAGAGSLLYPTNHYYKSDEELLTYQQTWHILSPAISFYGNFNKYFDIELGLKATPFIMAFDNDHHILTRTKYVNEMLGGLFIEPSLELGFKPANHLKLSLSFSYRNVTARGDTFIYSDSNPDVAISKTEFLGGAGYSMLDIAFGIRFTI
ncbi:MAG: omptin family outer membrane protease PgtE [Termitinemataceae bacterium]|nr:MAG: omptin family outer membrane protease PgtE [Termitinemataceae bacterium]